MWNQYDRKSKLNLIFWTRLNRFQTKLMRHLSLIMARDGLTLSQFSVLEALYHKGPLSIGDIKEAGLMTGGNLTVVISNLEKKGLIQLAPDPTDKRRKINRLTNPGKILIKRVFQEHLTELNQILASYNEQEKLAMARLLGQPILPGEDSTPPATRPDQRNSHKRQA